MLKILVADDEEQIRVLLTEALTSNLDCKVEGAESAAAAISLLSRNVFHLVISDLNMSDSGLDILKFIKNQNLNISMILFSSSTHFFLPPVPQLIAVIEKPNFKNLLHQIKLHFDKCA